MATSPFANVGLGMLGSEKAFMGGGGSDVNFFLGSLLKKALEESNVPLAETANTENTKPDGVAPPQASAPASSSTGVPPSAQPESNDAHPESKKILDFLFPTSSSSVTTPNVLATRNPQLDQVSQQTAVAPPVNLNLPEYRGGFDPSKLLALFTG